MIEIRLADKDNFHVGSLESFDRFQQVHRVYRVIDGEPVLTADPFTETWDSARKREKEAEIMSGTFVTYCAFDGERIVGEIMLVPQLDGGRLIIDSFHVSHDCRRRGIGRMLLASAENEALRRGATALYASACSAEETVKFYTAMGFELSERPIPFYAEDEPCDLQMEKSL